MEKRGSKIIVARSCVVSILCKINLPGLYPAPGGSCGSVWASRVLGSDWCLFYSASGYGRLTLSVRASLPLGGTDSTTFFSLNKKTGGGWGGKKQATKNKAVAGVSPYLTEFLRNTDIRDAKVFQWQNRDGAFRKWPTRRPRDFVSLFFLDADQIAWKAEALNGGVPPRGILRQKENK